MGDAAGQGANAFQPLRAQELRLQIFLVRDVGVDREVSGCIETRPHREDKCEQNGERGKSSAGFDNRYN